MFDQKMVFSKDFQVSSPAQLISERVKCTDSHQQFLQRPRHLALDALLQSLSTDVLVFNESWTNEKTVKKWAWHYKQSKLETLFWMAGWFTLSQMRYASFAENVDKFRLICAPLLLTGVIKRLCRNKMTCFTIQSTYIWFGKVHYPQEGGNKGAKAAVKKEKKRRRQRNTIKQLTRVFNKPKGTKDFFNRLVLHLGRVGLQPEGSNLNSLLRGWRGSARMSLGFFNSSYIMNNSIQ